MTATPLLIGVPAFAAVLLLAIGRVNSASDDQIHRWCQRPIEAKYSTIAIVHALFNLLITRIGMHRRCVRIDALHSDEMYGFVQVLDNYVSESARALTLALFWPPSRTRAMTKAHITFDFADRLLAQVVQ